MENSIDHIITRILSGNSSSEDFLSLSEWLNADEKNKKEFRLLKSYWDAEVSFSHSLMPNVSLDNLRKKIDDQSRQKRLRLIRFIATPIAAAIAFLVLFFATIHLNTREAKVQQFYTYITDKNKSHFTLDDGTKIILNRNSRFTYSDAYGTDQRKVNLEGEAYFDVAEDGRPFQVITSQGEVTVLGTAFGISSYMDKAEYTTLVRGCVRYTSHTKKSVILSPGEQAILERSGELISRKVEVEEYVGWKDGVFVFRDKPLEEIMETLSRWYGSEVVFRNEEMKQLKYTGSLERYDSINTFLQVLERLQDIHYEIDNNKIKKLDSDKYVSYKKYSGKDFLYIQESDVTFTINEIKIVNNEAKFYVTVKNESDKDLHISMDNITIGENKKSMDMEVTIGKGESVDNILTIKSISKINDLNDKHKGTILIRDMNNADDVQKIDFINKF